MSATNDVADLAAFVAAKQAELSAGPEPTVGELREALHRTFREYAKAVERVRALANEWAGDGPSLVRNAYSGSDVDEGLTLERCSDALRAALSVPQDAGGGEGQSDGQGPQNGAEGVERPLRDGDCARCGKPDSTSEPLANLPVCQECEHYMQQEATR